MVVPAYCRSRQGRVFRIQRLSESLAPDRIRYVLRATPIRLDAEARGIEATREIDTALLREKLRLRQHIPTPEDTFESLWQQLRLDLDAP
jgi:hypothetical protein